jgi:hypothetical protein
MKNSVAIIAQEEVLSKEQEKFNSLISKLDLLQAEEKRNIQVFEHLRVQYSAEIVPLQNKYNETAVAFLVAYHHATHHIKLKKQEREALNEYMLDVARDFLMQGFTQAIEVFDYYSPQNFEDEKVALNAIRTEEFRNLAERDGYEVDPNLDIDWSNQEQVAAFMAEFSEKMAEQMKEEKNSKKTKPKKKKSKAETEKETEETQIAKLKRGIYMELAKRYHPDKYQTEEDKERAKETMQRITDAYEKDDLLLLFKLQLELGTTLKEHEVQSFAEAQLKVINKNMEASLKTAHARIKEIVKEASSIFEYPIKHLSNDLVTSLVKSGKRELNGKIKIKESQIRECNNEKIIQQIVKQHTTQMTTMRRIFDDW